MHTSSDAGDEIQIDFKMTNMDPEMQKQINEVARAMVQKIYQEIINEDQMNGNTTKEGKSFTL